MNRSSDSGSCWHQMVAIPVCVPEQQVASTKARVKPQKLIGNKITWNIVEAVLANFQQTQIYTFMTQSWQCMSWSKIIGALRAVALAASSFSSLVVSPTCCRCPRSWRQGHGDEIYPWAFAPFSGYRFDGLSKIQDV